MKNVVVVCAFVLVAALVKGNVVERSRSALRSLKPDYGQPFDEITVNSSLNIRRKNQTRTAREAAGHKRQSTAVNPQLPPGFPSFPAFPSFNVGASAGSAQSQAFNSHGPVADFGASATGSQTQAFNFGPGGISGSAGISGSQQYNLNGMTIDVSFGDVFSAAANGGAKSGADGNAFSISVTGPNGKKIPIAPAAA